MLVSSTAFLFTPETRGRPLAQNVHDLEKSGQTNLMQKACCKARTRSLNI